VVAFACIEMHEGAFNGIQYGTGGGLGCGSGDEQGVRERREKFSREESVGEKFPLPWRNADSPIDTRQERT
jgi:hypothetical protein